MLLQVLMVAQKMFIMIFIIKKRLSKDTTSCADIRSIFELILVFICLFFISHELYLNQIKESK